MNKILCSVSWYLRGQMGLNDRSYTMETNMYNLSAVFTIENHVDLLAVPFFTEVRIYLAKPKAVLN